MEATYDKERILNKILIKNNYQQLKENAKLKRSVSYFYFIAIYSM